MTLLMCLVVSRTARRAPAKKCKLQLVLRTDIVDTYIIGADTLKKCVSNIGVKMRHISFFPT